MANDCYVGDVGFEIFIATGIDLTGASAREIRYRKPDGTGGRWTASAYNKDGTDGARYVTQADDLDLAGVWKLDLEITGLSGFTGSTSPDTLAVGRPNAGA